MAKKNKNLATKEMENITTNNSKPVVFTKNTIKSSNIVYEVTVNDRNGSLQYKFGLSVFNIGGKYLT